MSVLADDIRALVELLGHKTFDEVNALMQKFLDDK
jgi:hypothetical protein